MATSSSIKNPSEFAQLPKKHLRGKSRVARTLRIILTIALLIAVYSMIDLRTLFHSLRSLSLPAVLYLALLYTLGQVLSAFKWRIFVSSAQITRPFIHLVRAYFFGMFVNTMALGTIGGDLARSLALNPEKGKKAAALSTVAADRLHGLGVLLVIGALGIILAAPQVFESFPVSLIYLGIISLSISWWLAPRLLPRIVPKEGTLAEVTQLMLLALERRPAKLLEATVISAAFHCIQIYMHSVMAAELGADISFVYLLATVPIINFASSLPITVNGFGVREAMCVFLFAPQGVSSETAVAFGTIWLVMTTVVSLIGGVIVISSTDLSYNKIKTDSLP